jgi:hypothetical protein
MRISFILLTLLIFYSCSGPQKISKTFVANSLEFLDQFEIPFGEQYDKSIIGGLSGIDYDAAKKVYYLISDDRSVINPARFYTANIHISNNKIARIQFTNVTFLKDVSGNFYPNSSDDPFYSPDPEALRYNRVKNCFTWCSEGERTVNRGKTVLQNPAIIETDISGSYLDTLPIPQKLQMQSNEAGPRQNGVFEGLAYDKTFKTLYASVEEPLYNDGPRAATGDSTGVVRILEYNSSKKKLIAEYAYIIDPVAYAPHPANGFKLNGISDILWLGRNRLLVIERSFSVGRTASTIKVYLADLSKATNINKINSLKTDSRFRPASKKLLLNMDSLAFPVDNIEGVTFGPRLPSGKRSLLFVSDNNFDERQKTQILLFAIKND